MKSVKSVHRPSTYDKRLNIRKNADKKHRIVRKEHVLPGERTIMFNMNQPMTDDIDPYKSACVSRCNMCGIPINYKNTQLISQFTSPFSGKLYTQPRTGMCSRKYKELKGAHSIASDLLLIGPAKDPIFAEDPVLAMGLPKRYREAAESMGGLTHKNSIIGKNDSLASFTSKEQKGPVIGDGASEDSKAGGPLLDLGDDVIETWLEKTMGDLADLPIEEALKQNPQILDMISMVKDVVGSETKSMKRGNERQKEQFDQDGWEPEDQYEHDDSARLFEHEMSQYDQGVLTKQPRATKEQNEPKKQRKAPRRGARDVFLPEVKNIDLKAAKIQVNTEYDQKYTSTFNFIDTLDDRMKTEKTPIKEPKPIEEVAEIETETQAEQEALKRAEKAAKEGRAKLLSKMDLLRQKRAELSISGTASDEVVETKKRNMTSLRDELKAKRKLEKQRTKKESAAAEAETNNDDVEK